VDNPNIQWLTGTEIEVSADRPFTVYADGDRSRPACHDQGHEAVPARDRTLMLLKLKLQLARALRAVSRRLGRTGGTTLPGRVLLRLDSNAIGELGTRLERGSVLVSATNGRRRPRRCSPPCWSARAPPWCTPRRLEHALGRATALLDAGRAPDQIGLFEVDEAWLAPVARELDPRCASVESLPRPASTATASSTCWRTVGRAGGRARGPHHVRSERRRPAGGRLRRDASASLLRRGRSSHSLEALEHASARSGCRNCGHDYVYEAVYLGHLGRYHCPTRSHASDARGGRRTGTLHGMFRLRRADPRRGPIELSRRCRPLQLYNALAATAAPMQLGATPDQIRDALAAFAAGVAPRGAAIDRPRELAILLVKTRRRNEVLAHADARGRPARSMDRADVRSDADVSWIWDATSRCWPSRAHGELLRHAPEEMALR